MVREVIEEMELNEYAEDTQVAIDMSLNENPLGPSEQVVKAVRNISPGKLSRYQHSQGSKKKLASFLDLAEKELILTNGCDGALEMVSQTFFDKGVSVAIPLPSFPRYRTHAQKMGAEIKPVCSENRFHPSIGQLKSVDVDYMILANPQNPSGEIFSISQLKDLNNSFEGHLIVDEALAHFSQNHSELVSEGVTVVGSFSKLFGIAGLRAGYIASCHKEDLAKTGSPFKINSVAQIAIEAVIGDNYYVAETREVVEEELERLKEGLEKQGINYSDSQCLTMLLDFRNTVFENKASKLGEKLLDKGVKVVEGKQFEGLDDNYLRISIRNKEANQKFLDKIYKLMETEKIKGLEVEN